MANKNFKIGVTDVVLLVISIFFAVGIFTFFSPCGPKADGTWMICHWAGHAVQGLSIVLAVISVIHLIFQNENIKLGLDFSILPLALFTAILPGNIINLCMMKTMQCQTTMRPATIVLCVLIIIATIIDIILQRKKQ